MCKSSTGYNKNITVNSVNQIKRNRIKYIYSNRSYNHFRIIACKFQSACEEADTGSECSYAWKSQGETVVFFFFRIVLQCLQLQYVI